LESLESIRAAGGLRKMNPRLVALAGPHRGRVIPLDRDEFSCGRHHANDLSLPSPTISRRHCIIRKAGDKVTLVDLESSHGTFVNGLPVRERVLKEGDQIGLSDSVFLFLAREDATETGRAEPIWDDGDPSPRDSLKIRTDESIYLKPTLVMEALAPESKIAKNLSALLALSTTANSIWDPGKLQEKILESVLDLVPAERVAILLCSPDGSEFPSATIRERDPRAEGSPKLSLALARRVVAERSAFLSNELVDHPSIVDSSARSGIKAALCLPLEAHGELIGVLYADSRTEPAPFSKDHLQLATAAAAVAAIALASARRMELLEAETRALRKGSVAPIVGESRRVEEVRRYIERVGPKETTVMVRGETGTGKELVARALHDASPRCDAPFVAINCGALAETLLESELFGHEKGAFTGATAQRKGKLEAAHGGTVFLDEVGEMTPALQVKLLRVLQEREFERVGGNRPVKVDIRLIAATHRNLEEAVREGSFRADLFFRLNVVCLDVPPLRERQEDIPLLANHFIAKHAGRLRRKIVGLSPEARKCLAAHAWPGNVRELENAIEHALVLGASDEIRPEDLPSHLLESDTQAPASIGGFHAAVKEAKIQVVRKALAEAKDNYTQAAKLLGVHPNYLHRLVNNLNLRDERRK